MKPTERGRWAARSAVLAAATRMADPAVAFEDALRAVDEVAEAPAEAEGLEGRDAEDYRAGWAAVVARLLKGGRHG